MNKKEIEEHIEKIVGFRADAYHIKALFAELFNRVEKLEKKKKSD